MEKLLRSTCGRCSGWQLFLSLNTHIFDSLFMCLTKFDQSGS